MIAKETFSTISLTASSHFFASQAADKIYFQMCANYAGEEGEEPFFKELILLMRDWEYDDNPKNLTEMVNILLKVK